MNRHERINPCVGKTDLTLELAEIYGFPVVHHPSREATAQQIKDEYREWLAEIADEYGVSIEALETSMRIAYDPVLLTRCRRAPTLERVVGYAKEAVAMGI